MGWRCENNQKLVERMGRSHKVKSEIVSKALAFRQPGEKDSHVLSVTALSETKGTRAAFACQNHIVMKPVPWTAWAAHLMDFSAFFIGKGVRKDHILCGYASVSVLVINQLTAHTNPSFFSYLRMMTWRLGSFMLQKAPVKDAVAVGCSSARTVNCFQRLISALQSRFPMRSSTQLNIWSIQLKFNDLILPITYWVFWCSNILLPYFTKKSVGYRLMSDIQPIFTWKVLPLKKLFNPFAIKRPGKLEISHIRFVEIVKSFSSVV